MSDENKKDEEEVNGDIQTPKLGLFSGAILGALKILGLGLFVVIVAIVTSFLTSKFVNVGPKSYYATAEDFVGTQKEEYDWYEPTSGTTLKGVTNDNTRHTFIATLYIAYPLGNDGIKNELIQKRVPIVDILLSWFASKTSEYLKNIENREEIREALKNQIKQLMKSPDSIKDVRFSEYQVIDS